MLSIFTFQLPTGPGNVVKDCSGNRLSQIIYKYRELYLLLASVVIISQGGPAEQEMLQPSSPDTAADSAGRAAPSPASAASGTGALSGARPVARMGLFDRLDPALAAKVLSYLPASDVARAAAVSRSWRDICSGDDLWLQLLVSDFDLAPSDRRLAASKPREAYARRIAHRERKLKAAKSARIAASLDRLSAASTAKSQLRFGLCILPAMCLISPLLLAFLVLLAARLQANSEADSSVPPDDSPPPSWWWVAAPILAVFAAITCVCAASCRAAARIRGARAASPRYRDVVTSDWNSWFAPVRVSTSLIEGWQKLRSRGSSGALGRVVFVLWALCLTAAIWLIPMLIAWKLQSSPDASWGVVLVPLWVAFTLSFCGCCCFPLMGAPEMLGPCYGAWITMLCPLLITALLAALTADGLHSIPLYSVLIPVWVPFAALALFLTCGCLTVTGKFLWDRDRAEFGALAAFLSAFAIAIGLPIATLVLACLRSAGKISGMSWHAIFAPIYTWCAILTIMLTLATIAVCIDKVVTPWVRWRRREADPWAEDFGPPPGAAWRPMGINLEP